MGGIIEGELPPTGTDVEIGAVGGGRIGSHAPEKAMAIGGDARAGGDRPERGLGKVVG